MLRSTFTFLRGSVAAAIACLCAAITAQAPEFSQQYKQRLGGALNELHVIVEQFDSDAAQFKLDRHQLLETYAKSREGVIRKRGISIAGTIERYKALLSQAEAMQSASSFEQPFIALNALDTDIARHTLRNYRPAIPVTDTGFIYAFFGFAAAIFMMLMREPMLTKRKKRGKSENIEEPWQPEVKRRTFIAKPDQPEYNDTSAA